MSGEKPKRKGSLKSKLLFLLVAFGAGVYVGVEYGEEIKSLADHVCKPAPGAPAKPFSVKLERIKTAEGAYEVRLVGEVDAKPVRRMIGRDLHTVRTTDRPLQAVKDAVKKSVEAFSESIKD